MNLVIALRPFCLFSAPPWQARLEPEQTWNMASEPAAETANAGV